MAFPPSPSSSEDDNSASAQHPAWADEDVLAPRQQGLPLHFSNSSISNSNNMQQHQHIVDSSTAQRRRGGQAGGLDNDHHSDEDPYDGGKGDKDKDRGRWPESGIGMESRTAPAPGELYGSLDGEDSSSLPPQRNALGKREFSAVGPKGKESKWDRLIPERGQPISWVSS
ncbi:hypothetical protein T439DRAFT_95027 [Meredithblackwellia eburnea MCA 4105]